ncbi:MAG: hypothetical protein JW943_12410 [Deltaproteobacteria bacterium]|nr:hypothetical protein [Deltaproteobacteria bacterium]
MSKKHFIMMGLAVVVFTAVLVMMSNLNATAGGGVNWKVTITNETSYKVNLTVWVEKMGIGKEDVSTFDLQPGASKTAETGAYCPCAVEGKIYIPNQGWRSLGVYSLGISSWSKNSGDFHCGAACWNSNIKVVKMVGDNVTEFRDFDFGFSK